MFIIENYQLAILFCVFTMLCWGSWANTQKLTHAPFQLFYWDYGFGILVLALIGAFTLGSHGEAGRSFIADIAQAQNGKIGLAIIGGVIFNLANILLVAAISIAGMTVAFPLAIGLSLALGVIVNYIAEPVGNPHLITVGVILILLAMLLSANAYKFIAKQKVQEKFGTRLALVSGLLMGLFYRFVTQSMSQSFATPQSGSLTPYSAMVFFALGIILSNFIFNVWMMKKPFSGHKTSMSDYFKLSLRDHMVGMAGGVIWAMGTLASFLASGTAGFAISYGLSQGATMVAAFWGVFIWKEFAASRVNVNSRLTAMFICYILGLICIIFAKVI